MAGMGLQIGLAEGAVIRDTLLFKARRRSSPDPAGNGQHATLAGRQRPVQPSLTHSPCCRRTRI